MKTKALIFFIATIVQFIYGQNNQNLGKILIQAATKDSILDSKITKSHILKSTSAINYCDYIDCKIYAQDDKVQYLGVASVSKFDSESIINSFGDYGSEFSLTSIRNSFSDYGDSYSKYSAFNSSATKPPILYQFNNITELWEIAAYLTRNTSLYTGLYPKLDPDILIVTLEYGNCLPINNYCDLVDCKIYAQDSKLQYLGKASQNVYDSESIINSYGDYGSEYSQTSIRNSYSDYGDSYSNYSAFNSSATKPPILYQFNNITELWEIAAYLTRNTSLYTGLYPKLDPDILIVTLEYGNCPGPIILNYPPLFMSIAITTATPDIKYNYNITTIDVDGDILTITAPTKPEWLTLSDYGNGTALLSGTPSSSDAGTHTLKLRVSDGTVSVDQDFVITVSNLNNPPSFTSTPITTATQDIGYSYIIGTTDTNGDVMTITAPIKPGWLSFIDYGVGVALLSGTPSSSDVGTHNVKLRVNDGTVSVDQDFVITVTSINTPPTFTSTAVTTATQGLEYEYNITASDIDGNTITITVPTKPQWLTFTDFGNGTALLNGTPNSSNVGNHNVKLRVNDGTVLVDQDFIITVTSTNHPPTFNSTAITSATPNIPYIYSIDATDVDGDTLSITAPIKPEWLALNDYGFGIALLIGTPTNSHIGLNIVKLKVSDGTVSIDQDFVITVLSAIGIQDDYSSSFKLYPNPFSNELNVILLKQNLKDISIRIFDISGQVRYSEMIECNSKREMIPIPVLNLESGIYILQIQSNEEYFGKLIIKK